MKLNKEFWHAVIMKLVENLVSVKVWVIFALLIVSSILLMNGLLTPQIWGSVNAGVISTVFALREGFKVAKVKQISKDMNGIDKKEILDKLKEMFT